MRSVRRSISLHESSQRRPRVKCGCRRRAGCKEPDRGRVGGGRSVLLAGIAGETPVYRLVPEEDAGPQALVEAARRGTLVRFKRGDGLIHATQSGDSLERFEPDSPQFSQRGRHAPRRRSGEAISPGALHRTERPLRVDRCRPRLVSERRLRLIPPSVVQRPPEGPWARTRSSWTWA